MTQDSGQLNGKGVQWARVTLPKYGRWHIDAKVMGLSDTSGPATFTFSGLTFSGTIYRSVSEGGAMSVRIVGGKNALGTALPPKAYSTSKGVMLSVVLSDLSRETGENIVLASDMNLGVSYVRLSVPPSMILTDLLGEGGWWMDRDGTIRTATRDASAITSEFMATSWRGAAGTYVFVPSTPGDWTPGRSFKNDAVSGTISRVEHEIAAEHIQSTVMTGDGDRMLSPVTRIVDEARAALLYYLTWPYTVLSVAAGPPVKMQLRSNDSRAPDLQNVVLWPGASGAWATPPNGAAVRVRFVAADPTQPEIVALDPGNAPTTVTIAGGGPAAARTNDATTITSTITGAVSGGTCTITKAQFDAAQPFISGGSSKTTIG